jgi:hypothetical protein
VAVPPLPPLLGDVESVFGGQTALFALIIGSASSVATIVEVALAPNSTTWVLSLAASSLLEMLSRTGMTQRIELRVAARLAGSCGLQWPTRHASCSALKLVYLRSLGGTGYIAPVMALCVGSLRAVTFGDPAMIVWLDVNQTLWRVLLAQFVAGLLVDAIVWAFEKGGLRKFELTARFADGHPLRNTAFRDFDLKTYIYVFGSGGMFIYAIFIAFLGPAFVMGMCRNFTPQATDIWIYRTLECTNATAIAGLANATLHSAVRL